jgi:cell division protein FtsQ
MLAGGAFAWRVLNQPIHVVRIEGALTAGERDEIRTLLADLTDVPLMNIDLAAVRARVAELSWPRNVTLRRVWPYDLAVHVDKEMLVARWADGGYVTTGATIVQSPDEGLELPLFDCTFATPERAMEVYRMLQELAGRAGFEVRRLAENELGEWRLTLDGGLEVVLGAERLPERMHRFLLALRRLPEDRALEYVDARYGNGIAVRWKEPLIAEVAR